MIFKKLSAKNKESNLNLTVKGNLDLLKYIQNFENTWKINKIKLLADIHFNFGLTLEENSDLENALIHFTQSKNFYNEAAKIAAGSVINRNFNKELSVNTLSKELRIHLERISDSDSKWTIINEPSLAQSITEKHAIEVKSFNKKKGLPSKLKFKSNKESTYSEPKNQN